MESATLKFVWRRNNMNAHFQVTRIQNYLSGRMNAAEMHALEREALEDPFLQDALEGYKMQQGVDSKQLSLLQQRLAKRIEQKAIDRNRQFFSWQRLAVGAIAGVLFVVACVFMLLKNSYFKSIPRGQDVQLTHPFEESIEIAPSYAGEGEDAFPKDGWKHLNTYIVDNNKLVGVKGKLKVRFEVVEGHPNAIQVLDLQLQEASGVDTQAFIAEVTRLLSQGPLWSGKQAEVLITYH